MSNKRTTKENECRPTQPHKGASTAHESNPFAIAATPEGEEHIHAWNRALASNWSELRPVLRERALGIVIFSHSDGRSLNKGLGTQEMILGDMRVLGQTRIQSPLI